MVQSVAINGRWYYIANCLVFTTLKEALEYLNSK